MDDMTLSSYRIKGLMISYPHILHHGAIAGVKGWCRCATSFAAYFRGGGLGLTRRWGRARKSCDGCLPERYKSLVVTRVHIDRVGRMPCLLAAGAIPDQPQLFKIDAKMELQ